MATTTGTYDIDYLNTILRGEISAVETYEKTLEKFAGKLQSVDLIRIRDEHKQHVQTLSEFVRKHGGEPSTSSGPWGAFTNALTAVAKMVGPDTALAALKQGEQWGHDQYEKALERKDLPEEAVTAIRSRLLPETTEHLATLDRLMQSNSSAS